MPRNRSPASPHGLSSWPVRFTTWFNPGFGRILSDRIACQSARFKKGEPLAHPFLFLVLSWDVPNLPLSGVLYVESRLDPGPLVPPVLAMCTRSSENASAIL